MNTSPTLPIGTRLKGAQRVYTITAVLGQGGFGITYKAVTTLPMGNIQVPVTVAIKEHFLSDLCERKSDTVSVDYSNPVKKQVENSLKDFISEAKRLLKIGAQHPNIVKVDEVFQANNTAYYVMEYLDGESLRQFVERQPAKCLHENVAIAMMTPIIHAIGALHNAQMTHLDIKPDNIVLRNAADGRLQPVLIDFGLAKHYDSEGKPTSTINTLGYTPGFAPIEQFGGITSFSPKADIFALGATLLYCLTGQTTPKADRLIDQSKIRALLPEGINHYVGSAIVAAMNSNVEQRTDTAEQLLEQLNGHTTASAYDNPIDVKIEHDQEEGQTQPLQRPKPTATSRLTPWWIAVQILIAAFFAGAFIQMNLSCFIASSLHTEWHYVNVGIFFFFLAALVLAIVLFIMRSKNNNPHLSFKDRFSQSRRGAWGIVLPSICGLMLGVTTLFPLALNERNVYYDPRLPNGLGYSYTNSFNNYRLVTKGGRPWHTANVILVNYSTNELALVYNDGSYRIVPTYGRLEWATGESNQLNNKEEYKQKFGKYPWVKVLGFTSSLFTD